MLLESEFYLCILEHGECRVFFFKFKLYHRLVRSEKTFNEEDEEKILSNCRF